MTTKINQTNLNLDNTDQSNKNIETTIDITDKNSPVQKLTNQINFSTKALEKKQQVFSEILEQSVSKLNDAIDTFNNSITNQQTQYEILQNEVGILTLLPEQTKVVLRQTVPDIAKEIDAIQQKSMEKINATYQELITEYIKQCTESQKQTNQMHKNMTSSTQNFLSSIDQKLEHYSKKLSDSANHVIQYGNYGFIKNMCFVVLFSAIISGITSYVVTTQFPRYVDVTGASSLTINDSNVHVLGAKPLKEPQNSRIKN